MKTFSFEDGPSDSVLFNGVLRMRSDDPVVVLLMGMLEGGGEVAAVARIS